jgi:hypothetical protein
MDFRNSSIQRLIVHLIRAKDLYSNSKVEPTHNLTPINEDITKIIIKRVTNACGRPTKSFEVEIEDESKFLTFARELKSANDTEFISISTKIADSLAVSQTMQNATEGYLFVIDGRWENGCYFCILIKASFDNGINTTTIDGQTIMQLVEKLLLSSNQKLFKIGILHEELKDNAELVYKSILFDDQISTGEKPATYFYSTFLGLRIDNNPKKKTQMFYRSNKAFIQKIEDDVRRIDVMNGLVMYLKNEEIHASAIEFSRRHIPSEFRDLYDKEIISVFPHAFIKDNTLIKTVLRVRTLSFGRSKVKVSAPSETFDNVIKLIQTEADLEQLQVNQGYSILKISGRPEYDA